MFLYLFLFGLYENQALGFLLEMKPPVAQTRLVTVLMGCLRVSHQPVKYQVTVLCLPGAQQSPRGARYTEQAFYCALSHR